MYFLRLKKKEAQLRPAWTAIQRLFGARINHQRRKQRNCIEGRRTLHEKNIQILETMQSVFTQIGNCRFFSEEFLDDIVRQIVKIDEDLNNPGLLSIQNKKRNICKAFLDKNMEEFNFGQEDEDFNEEETQRTGLSMEEDLWDVIDL